MRSNIPKQRSIASEFWRIPLLLFLISSVQAEPFELGQQDTPIVITDDVLRPTAETLSVQLSRIFDAPFKIITESATPSIQLRLEPGKPAPFERERYSIRANEKGIVLSGATEHSLRNAIWDFLHRLGYRQFFPGENWEIVPNLDSIALDLDITESPDYIGRRIWYGYGLWEHNPEAYQRWCERNRMAEAFKLHTGHAYGTLIRRNQEIFDAHPEFYALIDGERDIRPHAKFCIGNPELRRTIVDYTVSKFEADPTLDSASMDPSDGGGWCECDLCEKIGPPSDRALLLANEVAAAVNERFPGKIIGMYAYAYHSPPPSIEVHPQVVISTATAFIKGGLKIDDLIKGWAEKGATIGIREYYSVNTWDRDMPGAARGSNLDYLCETIPKFHSMGARFLSAESSDNWGCNGLGYYLASRLLWDVNAVERRDEIIDDFLTKSFGKASEPMRNFYELIDGSNKRAKLVPEDQIGRMFRLLEEARMTSPSDAVLRRLDDLTLYTHYVALFDQYRNSEGDARQIAFEEVIRHAYRMRDTMMVHSYGLYRDLNNRDNSVSIPDGAHWKVPEPENPWKSSEPFTKDEIAIFIERGIADHELVELDFEPAEFSEDLVPAEIPPTSLQAGSAERGRGPRSFYTWTDSANSTIKLHITGGLIKHYRDRGNVRVDLWKVGGPSQTGEAETLIAENDSVPPDGVERTITLNLPEPGVYRIDVNDGMDMTSVTWPEGQLMSWKMTLDEHPKMISGRWGLLFYVPEGTKRVGLYVDANGGRLLRPDGEVALDFSGGVPGQFLSAEVPDNMDGQLWKLDHMAGRACLMNVPPYLAAKPEELLLPK